MATDDEVHTLRSSGSPSRLAHKHPDGVPLQASAIVTVVVCPSGDSPDTEPGTHPAVITMKADPRNKAPTVVRRKYTRWVSIARSISIYDMQATNIEAARAPGDCQFRRAANGSKIIRDREDGLTE
jgi:hypothetical protein